MIFDGPGSDRQKEVIPQQEQGDRPKRKTKPPQHLKGLCLGGFSHIFYYLVVLHYASSSSAQFCYEQ